MAKKSTRKTRKAKAPRKSNGGGKALPDFGNGDTIKVLKGAEIARKGCFRNGQTVAQCLAAQKAKGLRGRRKYIRKQIALGRISLKTASKPARVAKPAKAKAPRAKANGVLDIAGIESDSGKSIEPGAGAIG